jgi:hypothetical protein
LVVINELSSDKARHVNEFKAMVTGATMTLEEKYKAARTVPNIANFMITTNELAPLLVHSTNRRDVIMRVNFLSDKQILEIGRKALVLVDWCKAGGYRIMQHWYEQRDISKYNPFGYAPRFKGFSDAVEASKSNNQIYADEVLDFAATLENGALITRDMIEVLCGIDQHAALQVIRLLMKAQEYCGKHKVKEGKGNLSWAHLIGVPRDKVVNMSALIRDTRDALAQQMMP